MITKQTKLSITIVDGEAGEFSIHPGTFKLASLVCYASDSLAWITYDEAKAIRKVLKNLMRASRGEE